MLSLLNNCILQADVYLAAVGLLWCTVTVCYIIASLWRAIRVFVLSRIFPLDLTFYGEWAVVTGGSSGIGKSYARLLARRGMNIVLISNELDALESTAKEIESEYGVICNYIHADFTKGLEVYDRVMDEIGDKVIGILINGAGIAGKSPCYFLKERDNNVIAMIDLHVRSVVYMSFKILPAMLSRKKGIIINISSMSSVIPQPFFTLYSACKAFSDRFTRSLYWECITKKGNYVSFQSIIPFFVDTRLVHTPKGSLFRKLSVNSEKFTASAVATIGITEYTSGCWIHELIWFGITVIPTKLIHKIVSFF